MYMKAMRERIGLLQLAHNLAPKHIFPAHLLLSPERTLQQSRGKIWNKNINVITTVVSGRGIANDIKQLTS